MRCNTPSVCRFLCLSTCIVFVSCTTAPEPSPPEQAVPVQEEAAVAQAYAIDQPEIGAVEVLGSDLQVRVMLGETTVGKSVYLSEYSNKAVLVNYWSSWCTECWQAMLELQRLYNVYGQLGLVVVHVNYGETAQAVKNYLDAKTQVPTMILVKDHSGQASEAQGIFSVPAAILYDQMGQEIGRYGDDFDVSRIRKDLIDLLK